MLQGAVKYRMLTSGGTERRRGKMRRLALVLLALDVRLLQLLAAVPTNRTL
jgi:hypothetical protein